MRIIHLVTTVVLAVGVAACVSAPVDVSPGVTQEGRYLMRYQGPEISAELEYRLAKYSLGDQWLLFKVSLASEGGTVRVQRDAVRVRAPAGNTFVLIEQEGFRANYGLFRANLDRSNAWNPPTDQFAYFRRPCERWLLAPPGAAGSFLYQSPLILNANQWCSGPLVFQVPVGVQPGRWLLMIDLEESDVRIPFELMPD